MFIKKMINRLFRFLFIKWLKKMLLFFLGL